MKKLILVLCILMPIYFVGCGYSTKEDLSLENIKRNKKIIVGLDDSFPPMGFRNNEGEIVGFDIDMAKELGKKMNVDVEFKAIEWDGVIGSLNNKDIDIIWNGLTITDKRRRAVEFSNPYLQNGQIIVVRSNSNIKDMRDLSNKILGVQMGSSSDLTLSRSKGLLNNIKDINKYSKNTEALMDLSSERIDAVVVDEVVGKYYISKKPGKYKILKESLGKEYYGIGFRKEDIKFKNEVNRILEKMNKEGITKNIYIKWFGSKF